MTTGPTFAQQRIVCLALLGGIAAYAAVVAFLLQDGTRIAPEPVPPLDMVSIVAGIAVAIAATAVRAALGATARNAPANERANRLFIARLAPIALLEGGAMLGITTWLINADPMPGALVAGVLFALGLVFVPFTDPDANAI